MHYDCRAIANTILDLSDQFQLHLTHMAVHKIMYYAHGWNLVKHGEPLIEQEFEAWKQGPVQKLVWDSLKISGKSAVVCRAKKFDLVTQSYTLVQEAIAAEPLELLCNVVLGYGTLHAFELSEMTHERHGPWDRVWNAPSGRIAIGMRISNRDIQANFSKAIVTGKFS